MTCNSDDSLGPASCSCPAAEAPERRTAGTVDGASPQRPESRSESEFRFVEVPSSVTSTLPSSVVTIEIKVNSEIPVSSVTKWIPGSVIPLGALPDSRSIIGSNSEGTLAYTDDDASHSRPLAPQEHMSLARAKLAFHPPPGKPRALDPALLGSLSVCPPKTYNFQAQLGQNIVLMRGRICFPVISPQLCLPTGKQAVVLIFHAHGQNPVTPADDYLNYDALLRHLASHGYVALSVGWYVGSLPPLPEIWAPVTTLQQRNGIIKSTIAWLYGQSDARLNVTDNISVIGHSAGGKFLGALASISQAGKKLSAVISFTPSIQAIDTIEMIPMFAKAYLGLHTAPDGDAVSKPVLDPNNKELRLTGFVLYDLWEATDGFAKDFVYFMPPSNMQPYIAGHFYQNSLVAKAYVTAFLGFHVKGLSAYSDVFRLAIPPGTFKEQEANWVVRQQHGHIDASSFHRLCDFHIPSTFLLLSTSAVFEKKVGKGYTFSAWCPHDSYVAWFRFHRAQHARIIVSLTVPSNLTGYKYLAFRMGQVFDAVLQLSANTSIQVKVGINGLLAMQAPAITVPDQMVPAALPGDYKHTHSAMQTFAIPLSVFQGIDLSVVKVVYFDFTASGTSAESGAIIVASIEAWK